MKYLASTLALLCLTAAGALAAVDDLTGGALILHYPTNQEWTPPYPCDDPRMATCEEQGNQAPVNDYQYQWFVVVANFWEPKEFRGFEYGLDYDPNALGYAYYMNCPYGEVLEIPAGNFPDPGTGIAVALIGDTPSYAGNLIPLTVIRGYMYGDGVVSLTENPATQHAGWVNADYESFDAVCLGRLGIGTGQGIACCAEPPVACCFQDGSCVAMTSEECVQAGGMGDAAFTNCDPPACGQTPTETESWGAIKAKYR